MTEYLVFQNEVLMTRQSEQLRYPFDVRTRETYLLTRSADRDYLYRWRSGKAGGDWYLSYDPDALARYQTLALLQG